MKPLRLILATLTLAFSLAGPGLAQDEEDGGNFIERWLETNLSSAGRDVRVRGFVGALSSHATVAQITIADDEGVWFTLTNAELDWTRSALFSGRLEVSKLTAGTIEITRRPDMAGDGAKAESSQFALPDLPVSINIGEIDAGQVTFGADVLGLPVQFHLAASASLEAGAGQANLVIERTDDKQGALTLDGSYDNATRNLVLDLSLNEEAGGLVAGLIGLPGRSAIALTAQGDGPIDDFNATIALATDGEPRLTGNVIYSSIPPADGSAAPPVTSFHAEVAGDVSALFLPAYQDFFGPDVRLTFDGQRLPEGGLDISAFALETKALQLTGDLRINALGWPERVKILGNVGATDGAPVLLPMTGTETTIGAMRLAVTYDSSAGEAWSLDLTAQDVSRTPFALGSARITGSGTLTPGGAGGPPQIEGRIDLAADGIQTDDPALAAAIGAALRGGFAFRKGDEEPLQVSDLTLEGENYQVAGGLTIGRDPGHLRALLGGRITLIAEDLSRFAALAGRPLTGAANITISGDAALPRGDLDLELTGTGRDLKVGQKQFDALFAGESQLDIALARDAGGTRFDRFIITAPAARAEGSANLRSDASSITAQVAISDASRLAAGLTGAINMAGQARRDGEAWSYSATGSAPGETSLTLKGTFAVEEDELRRITGDLVAQTGDLGLWSGLADRPLAGQAKIDAKMEFDPQTGAASLTGTAESTDLALGLGDLDRLLAGEGTARFKLRRDIEGTVFADELALVTRELTLSATGSSVDDVPTLNATVRLRDLGLVVPGLSGPFTAEGEGTFRDDRWHVALTGDGAGGTTVRANGTIEPDFSRANLALDGRAPLEFANPLLAPNRVAGMAQFDLQLNGTFTLASLSGQVSSGQMSVALPGLGISLAPMTARANLSGGRAQVTLSSPVSSGGQVEISGGVSLMRPYAGDLVVRLAGVGIAERGLFETTADGTLSVVGPLAGGAEISGSLTLGPVEMQVPEAGFGVTGGIPDLKHIAEPANVRLTRQRAGLLGRPGDGSGGGPAYGLDITVNAPSRIFVRGRGLDAEFGGSVTLRGSTANVVPSGAFSLIRGRLDILGRRMVVNEGEITLQGSLDPTLHLVATTTAEDVTVRVIVEGRASSPSARFESSPSLPQEDVIALLIFGRGISELSPLQALRLASAVATLAGSSGAGIIGNLRQEFGLDDLDLTTDAEGNAAVKIGTYINENIYTDLSVDSQGRTEIDLNLTITPSITAKGRLSDDGSTGIGIYYERDY